MDTEMVSAEEARVVLQVAERTGQGDGMLARLARTVVAMHAEVAQLRAIIDGRSTPPTDADLSAHGRMSGAWRVASADLSADLCRSAWARSVRKELAVRGMPSRWWPLDDHGRPCAWPEVR